MEKKRYIKPDCLLFDIDANIILMAHSNDLTGEDDDLENAFGGSGARKTQQQEFDEIDFNQFEPQEFK